MKTAPLVLLALLLAGCVLCKTPSSFAERRAQYLADLPQQRERQWGPCECTYRFLEDTGAAGVPVVLQALDSFSGHTNSQMRALIVDGAWHFSRGTNSVVAPIMGRAAHDPAAEVNAPAKKWFTQQREAKKQN